MTPKQAKRFYKEVSLVAVEGGFQVMLDERALKSPAKAPLILPTKALAEAIRDEFDAQKEAITPETMPIFSLAATAIDRVMTQRKTLDDELVRFGHSDLISYRCPVVEDEVLAGRQAEMWGAIQEWMRKTHNVTFNVFDGVMPGRQPDDITSHLYNAVGAISDWHYVALYRATTLSASLSLGLRFVAGDFDVTNLMAHAFLDDYYQEEKWGADEWAIERRGHIETELDDAYRYLAMLA